MVDDSQANLRRELQDLYERRDALSGESGPWVWDDKTLPLLDAVTVARAAASQRRPRKVPSGTPLSWARQWVPQPARLSARP